MVKNNILLVVNFHNLPTDDNMYHQLVAHMQEDSWIYKHNIIENKTQDLDYYKLHKKLSDALFDHKTSLSEDVCLGDVNVSLYERFSKEYSVDLDLQISKVGAHIEESLDETSVNYYNLLHTFVKNGTVYNQSFFHISPTGVLGDAHISFSLGECKRGLKDLYPMLMSRLESGSLRTDIGHDYSLESDLEFGG